jgi:hypothetical protein
MRFFDLIIFDRRAVEEPEPVSLTVEPADLRGFVTT